VRLAADLPLLHNLCGFGALVVLGGLLWIREGGLMSYSPDVPLTMQMTADEVIE
jgi:hypothetical protein